MKHPWQIWLAYLVSLALIVVPLAALTRKVVRLDESEQEARRWTELERKVGMALWRMDSEMTQLLAAEVLRPVSAFRPLRAPAKGETAAPPPLLVQPSDLVLLHFEIRDNQWFSPQCPDQELRMMACEQGASEERIDLSEQRLRELSEHCQVGELMAALPETMLVEDAARTNWLVLNPLNSPEQQGYAGNPLLNSNGAYPVDPELAQQQRLAPPFQERSPTQQVETPLGPSGQIAADLVGGQQDPNVGQQLDSEQQQSQPLQQAALQGMFQQGASQPAASQQGARMRGGNASRRGINGDEQSDNDYNSRYIAAQNTIRNQLAQNRDALSGPLVEAERGPSEAVWIDGRLLLARRVVAPSGPVVQGCWLDWDAIRRGLLAGIGDLLPDAELAPLEEASRFDEELGAGRLLATLPVALYAPLPAAVGIEWTPIEIALAAAWSCVLAAAIAVALLLHGVVKLSERRGAFVSAVTHELRTPLTTFRLYAELLAGGMVTTAEQQREYAETLRLESLRLSHLVENVLGYARIERRRSVGRRERLPTGDVLDRCLERLQDRASQAEMKLEVACDDEAAQFELDTDPAAIEQILFNLVDNACKYAAGAEDRRIEVRLARAGSGVAFHIRDHGPGLSPARRRSLFRPFSKSAKEAADSAPGVGLGLALCRRLARQLGGRLDAPARTDGAEFVLRLR